MTDFELKENINKVRNIRRYGNKIENLLYQVFM